MTTDLLRTVYRELTDLDKQDIAQIKASGQNFIDLLNALPHSREISLAKTKIEEAVMWAVKGITA